MNRNALLLSGAFWLLASVGWSYPRQVAAPFWPFQSPSLASNFQLSDYWPANLPTANTAGSPSEPASAANVDVTGVVFEDVNYGGGAGRSRAASGGVPRPGVTVELYNNAGAFEAAATTDANGIYRFSVANGVYTVRVVSSTVSSSRPGYVAGLLPVPTFNGTSDHVGGEAPSKTDAPTNTSTQSLASLTTATTTAQAIASITVGSSAVAGPDFGFNFSTVVNPNDAGQGSLRQFILNSNALGGEGSLAQAGRYALQTDLPVGAAPATVPLPAGQETSIFMIADGRARPGLRAGLANQLVNGVAVLEPATALPALTGVATALNGLTQTHNVGNTNDVLLGTGGTVGTAGTPLARLNGPEVQLIGTTTSSVGVDVASSAANTGIYGLAVYGFGPGGAYNTSLRVGNIRLAGDNATLSQNVLGTSATAFADPGAASRSRYDNLVVTTSSASTSVTNNLIGFANGRGILITSSAREVVVTNNEIRSNAVTLNFLDGIDIQGGNSTVTGNLTIDNGGVGFDSYASVGSNIITGNTVRGNGRGTPEPGETPGIRLYGEENTVSQNIIADNYGAGVMVTSAAQRNRISQNSIFNNGAVTARNGGAATGQAGIDVLSPTNEENKGTAPYVTFNDNGDADVGANGLLNFPVLTAATIAGGTLTLTGFATPGALLEVYVAEPNTLTTGSTTANNFGQGRVLLFVRTEGDAADTDATTGSYGQGGALVNGFFQGTETNQNRFRFAVPVGSLTAAQQAALANGAAKLTATATVGGSTSEFSGNVAVGVLLAGVVFEDVNYGGGAGRSLAASGGVPRPGAAVELYSSAGALIAATATDAAGRYEFNAPAGAYTVRTVSGSVSSSRPGAGAGLVPVPTFVNGDANRVGGEAPEKTDAPANTTNATLPALTTTATTAQAVASVTLGAGGAAGSVDFGFNFDLIVNTNDGGQGSLRQFILNSNALTNAGLVQAGLPAGVETSIFMVPGGQPVPGLRAGLVPGLTNGVAIITPTTILPALTDANTAVDGRTQTANVGNTNAVVLGRGGTVGSSAVPLPQVEGPEVQLVGSANLNVGLDLFAPSASVSGLAIYGFGSGLDNFLFANVRIRGDDAVLMQNVIGTAAGSFTDPGAGSRTDADAVAVRSGRRVRVSNNLIGYVKGIGITVSRGVQQMRIENNELSFCAMDSRALDGIGTQGDNATITGNLIANSGGHGIDFFNSPGSTSVTGNTISGNGRGGGEMAGISIMGTGISVSNNLIFDNHGAGVLVAAGARNNPLSQNSIYNNSALAPPTGGGARGQLGIDLLDPSNSFSGTPPYVSFNDDGDADLGGNGQFNFPVLATATVQGSDLVLTGFAAAGTKLEVFVAQPNAVAAGSTTGNAFGQGRTFLFALDEGSAQDQDATTGSYGQGGALVNGFFQGTETNQNRFRFAVPLSSLPGGAVAPGAQLTATGTLAGNTSEFSGNVRVGVPLTGIVFEDVNYGGGGGRSRAASGGVPVGTAGNPATAATVELYNAVGALVTSTQTSTVAGSLGQYEFSVPTGAYTVRVVSNTVRSTRPGAVAGLLPVQTFNGTTDRVGGEAPEKTDAAANTANALLADLTTATATAQNVAAVTVGASGLSDIDFGFNFSTVVNTTDAGQGSLRQFILNSNALGGEGSLVQAGFYRNSIVGAAAPVLALPAGQETSIFMIPNGQAHPGQRAGLVNQLSAQGVAIITPATQLASVTGANTRLDGTTQTHNVGNTNNVVLGTGGTVGTGNTPLAQLNGPEVAIAGVRSINQGLRLQGAGIEARGLAVYGFGNVYNDGGATRANIAISGNNTLITQNVVGTPATSFTDMGETLRSNADNIGIAGGRGVTVSNNLVGFVNGNGLYQTATAGTRNVTITGNEFASNGLSTVFPVLDNITTRTDSTTVTANLITGAGGGGVDRSLANLTFITDNTIRGNGQLNVETAGIRLFGANHLISRNVITANVGSGVFLQSTAPSTLITENSIFANNLIGIDLLATGENGTTGATPYVTLNDPDDPDAGANGLLNFPVLTSATVNAGNLEVRGFARPGVTVELFIAAPDPTGFGEGQTYLASRTEGAADDADAGTGSYGPAAVNGLSQGQDNTNRFSFSIPLSSLPAGQQAALNACGTKLTATATLTGSTSEFSGNVGLTPAPVAIRISGAAPVCAGETVRLRTGPRPGYLFTWYNGTTVVNGSGAVLDDSVLVVNVSGTYTVQLTQAGCATASTTSPPVSITVLPAVLAGTIGTDQTLCAGAQPAALVNLTAASGGTGTVAYQWETSTDNTNWTAIGGATAAAYTPAPVAATSYFRRRATSGTCAPVFTAAVTLTVLPTLTAGTIATDQTVCVGAAPAALTNVAGAGGGTGTYAYQWESSVNLTTWTAITGATGPGYAPAPVTTTTHFRRQVVSGTGTCAAATSNTVTLTVLPTLVAGSTSASQTVCAGNTPAPFTSNAAASGGTGSYAYQWQSSADNLTWTDIAGATGTAYAPGPLTATTHFRRAVVSGTGSCATAYASPLTVTVTPVVAAGSIGASQTLCANTAPAPLTSTAGASGGTGTYVYQWEVSTNNASWTAVAGATNPDYAPGPLTSTTYFRRQVTSGTGSCAAATSNIVTLTVTPAAAAGVALAAPPAQCAGSTLTFTPTPTNGGPAPTFRWFVNNVLTATGPTFSSAALANNDQVRVEMTPTPGTCTTGMPTATATVTLTPLVQPAVSVRAASTGPVCAGTVQVFNVDNVSGAGTAPQYQWLLNGVAVPGATAATFSSATLADGDRLRVQLTSSAACASPAVVLSNELLINVRASAPPQVAIAGSGATCAGLAVRFAIASSANLGAAPTYQWRVDGADVAGAQGTTFSSTTLRNGQTVTLAVRTTTVCGQPAGAVSNGVQAAISPVVDVEAGPDKEILEGEEVVLEGRANGSYAVEWTPSQTLRAGTDPLRPVASPRVTTVYTLKASLNGCEDESRVTVRVGPPLRIPNAFSPNGDGTNDTWEIDRIGSFADNTVTIFNRWGNKVFSTTNYSRANEWAGRINGLPAPVGTYYYIIDLGNGKTYTGPLTIVY